MKKTKPLFIVSVVFFISLSMMLITFPSECRKGAEYGLYICGKTVIPSLFTFTVCVLFLMRCGVFSHMRFIDNFTARLFGISGEEFAVFIMSVLGGYPIGAKLIGDLVNQHKTSPSRAELMILYYTNAGPAFIIIAVGIGCFSSRNTGIILFLSSLLSSLIFAVFFGFKLKKTVQIGNLTESRSVSVSEIFTSSISDAAGSVITICSYVIFFSTLNTYIDCISEKIAGFERLKYITEVTSAITLTKNIYIISFLIGFSCICVWLQIYSVAKPLKIPPLKFIITRLIHGALNSANTFILIKMFKPTVSVISNNKYNLTTALYDTPTLAGALLLMGLLFCISVFSKKICGNIIKDMI